MPPHSHGRSVLDDYDDLVVAFREHARHLSEESTVFDHRKRYLDGAGASMPREKGSRGITPADCRGVLSRHGARNLWMHAP